jgi:hypothetical protein
MKTISVNRPVKVITSGNTPTLDNMSNGELAFGRINGVKKLFARTAGEVLTFDGNDINLLSLTASQFNSATFTGDTYVRITDAGTLALNSTFFARMSPGSIVNVLASGQVLIGGAIAPADSYEALSDGYRELSVIIDDPGEVIITVYEKPLYRYLEVIPSELTPIQL